MSELSLEQLIDRRADFLAFIERRVADPALAEDILQAAFVRALEGSGNLRSSDSVVAWFYRVLRNAVIDHYRRRASESRVFDPTVFDEQTADASRPNTDTRTFLCGCILHVLPMLRPAYAEILREVDLEELPLGEFARRHALTSSNAAVRAHRARAALRKALVRVCGACSIHACLDCCCKASSAA